MKNKFNLEKLTVKEFISKYANCPRCKSSMGVYTRVKTKGQWNDTTLFNGNKENTEMMDSFKDTWESKYIYCSACNKKVAIRL